jgi:hypothetical protein
VLIIITSLLVIPIIISPAMIALLIVVRFLVISFMRVLPLTVPALVRANPLQLQVPDLRRRSFLPSEAILPSLKPPHSPCDGNTQGAEDKSEDAEDNTDRVVDWKASTSGKMVELHIGDDTG